MYELKLLFFCLTFCYANSISLFNMGYLDTAKNPFQYFEENNYYYENHTIITQDGYKLLLVRIPRNKNVSSSEKTGPPILFVHGLLANFYDFLVTGPGEAFGFKALESGYDVFLLNVRGNRWSRSHVILDPDRDAKKFWNFSWNEIGKYDLPATIDYITNLTQTSNISYVGHSQGTTSFFVMTSTKPEYNQKIKLATLLAPVAYLTHAKNFITVLFKNHPSVLDIPLKILHIYEILPYIPIFSGTLRIICGPKSVLLPVCEVLLMAIAGPSTQINMTAVSAYLTNNPSGAAEKQFIHYLQVAGADEFRRYDYGRKGNLKEYGEIIPPNYNLSEVTAPVLMYYGSNDFFVAISDEARLASILPNVVKNVLVPYRKTNHLDFLMGTRVKDLVYEPALEILNEYNNL